MITLDPGSRLREVELDCRLDPYTREVTLERVPGGFSPESLRFPFHDAEKQCRFVLRLTNNGSQPRKLKIAVHSSHPGFSEKWARWSFAEFKGGDAETGRAVRAHDVAYGSNLELLVLPGGQRIAWLIFRPELDGFAYPDDYRFVVSVDGIDSDVHDEVRGVLAVRHPDTTLLNMLPSIYAEAMEEERRAGHESSDSPFQENPMAPFFERYLRGFEDTFSAMRMALTELHRLFGAYSTPPDFLVWLAAWVAMPMHESWPEMKRRQLIEHAVELFRWRGTRRGLSRFIEIYTGYRPVINDQPYAGMRLGRWARLGTKAAALGEVGEHSFVVNLTVPDPSAIDKEMVRQIIETEKPAHTTYILRITRRSSQLDLNSHGTPTTS